MSDYAWCPKCSWHIEEPCRRCARSALDRHRELEHAPQHPKSEAQK